MALVPVTPLERLNQTGFKFRSRTVSVPVHTRSIHAELTLKRKTNGGPYNDGYADNLSVVLRVPAVVSPN